MTDFKTLIKDQILLTGWILLTFSFALFCVPELTHISKDLYFGFFLVHFAISGFYFFLIFFKRSHIEETQKIHYNALRLILFLISAYALNREITVFAASPLWFCILLVIVCLNYLVSVFFQFLPTWARYCIFFVFGVAFVLFIYLTLYLFPMYVMSVFALLVLGISVHTFIPALFSIYTINLASQMASGQRRYWISFGAGITVSVIVCTVFVTTWNKQVQLLNNTYSTMIVEGDEQLPLWIQVAQKIENDQITEKILKTDIVYKISSWDNNLFWDVPERNFGEEQQLHDPLVLMANMFSGKVYLTEQDRIKILESQFNKRHQALERLWSGMHLKTELIASHVKVWPQLHLAYTEKFITVYNYQSKTRWPRQEEAIYTFHMPEGAVVTSLSLWINGKEEKGILTTKQKAETAYNTIVGVERRDPSVIHWQEGNTVSVRVFPVDAQSSRTFKIGITAPLRKEGSELAYDNTWFDGPEAGAAQETIKVEIVNEPNAFIRHASYVSSNGKTFTSSGKYKPRWTLKFRDLGLKPNSFSFNGNSYSIKPYRNPREVSEITDVYLDISQAWTSKEVDAVWKLVKNKRVWIYDRDLKEVNDANSDEMFSSVKKNQFSLFPFHLVTDRAHSLVITKTSDYTPNISDLEGSGFLKALRVSSDIDNRVKLFNLGTEFSPYHRSLKELRFFDYEFGDNNLLKKLLIKNVFGKDIETHNEVIVHSANVVIKRTPGEEVSTGPDHLMRLFAYNNIMKQLGGRNLENAGADSLMVAEAQEAYVVSPVSSLVVLETQKDYDRFGIKDNEQSLKNASLKNKGAVPEPGEWVLIIVGATFFLLFMLKWKIV